MGNSGRLSLIWVKEYSKIQDALQLTDIVILSRYSLWWQLAQDKED
jgi:hypothetical protein